MAVSAPSGRSFKHIMCDSDTFGITGFRFSEKEAIESISEGKDTLAVRPTCSGKSPCYQLPALNMPGVTVILPPLLDVMKVQAGKSGETDIEGLKSTVI